MSCLKRDARRGWSFVEITVVMGVMALLFGTGYMVARSMRHAARVCIAESRMRQIATGMELYYREYHSYPPQGSDLTQELAPFVDGPEVFGNPLTDETTVGETINALYREPTPEEIDSPGHYLTAMLFEDGESAVTLSTGGLIQSFELLNFVNGRININPSNNPHFEFTLTKPDGSTITRDMLHASRSQFTYGEKPGEKATTILLRPKGNGNQNSLMVNGSPYLLRNGSLYEITLGPDQSLYLYNDHYSTNGKAMGHWWIEITAAEATIVENP